MNMFMVLMMIMVSWVYNCPQTYQVVTHYNMCNFFNVSNT